MYVDAGGSVSNTVCYFNSAPAHPDWSAAGGVSLGYNCFSTNDFDQWPTIITNAPMFVNTNDGNYRLTSGSPCVNAGDNQDWMLLPGSVDLDGYSRIDRIARRVDMGCYELIPRGAIFRLR